LLKYPLRSSSPATGSLSAIAHLHQLLKYLLLGGGGAERDPILPGRTHNKVPEGYPLDQYWKGEDPKEDYSYLHVDVTPGQPTKFTLNRFRPWSAQPFATVELFK
jgi:hypothetical protein